MLDEQVANDAIKAAALELEKAIELSERVCYGSQVLGPLNDALRELRYAYAVATGAA